MIGINIPAGVRGEIINIEPFPLMQGTLIEIKLDEHHDDLDEFENVLQFVTEATRQSQITLHRKHRSKRAPARRGDESAA